MNVLQAGRKRPLPTPALAMIIFFTAAALALVYILIGYLAVLLLT